MPSKPTAQSFSLPQLTGILDAFLENWSQRQYVVALSGGLDSMTLLHAMVASSCQVRCVHVDHGVTKGSSQWAQFCQTQAAALGVPIEIHRLNSVTGGNLEETLREARRQLFKTSLHDGEVLLTAHHLDDQIETFFLRLMRGSGVTGLSAITNDVVAFGCGHLLRPLLGFTREQLKAYALKHKLDWIEDPSNQQTHFDRNYWRHTVMPTVLERWPSAAHTVSRSIELITESDQLNRELAALDAKISPSGRRLDWGVLSALSDARVGNAIRYWTRSLVAKPPPYERLKEAIRQFRTAGVERHPTLCWDDGGIERYRQELVFFPHSPPPDASVDLSLAVDQWCELPNACGRLKLAADFGVGLRQISSNGTQLSIRFRREGQRIRRSSGQHQTLKKWFQQRGVPPSRRDRMPLLMANDELIAVGDIWIDARFRAEAAAPSWRIDWQR